MNIQASEFSSFKSLLKQVFSAHASKVKELENQVKSLKEQLSSKERESTDNSDCPRCAELEAAFKSCKKALQEQSKFFETFGQKFSIFNDSEKGSLELKTSMNISTPEVRVLNDDPASSNESPTLLRHQDHVPYLVSASNQNIIKKFMNEDDSLNTFDLFSVESQAMKGDNTFTKKFNETIFAPDSVGIEVDSKKGVKRRSTDTFSDDEESRKASNKEPETSGKTSLNSSEKKSPKHLKNVPSSIESVICNKKISVPQKASETCSKVTNDIKVSHSAKKVETAPEAIEAPVSKNQQNSTAKESFPIPIGNKLNKISSPYDTSPSLIKAQTVKKIIDIRAIEADDDFVEIPSNNPKLNQCEDGSNGVVKQKASKKPRQFTRCTSKYKMTLDALPLNYKRPNYKQSKLSKSFFQGKKNVGNPDIKDQGLDFRKEYDPIPTIVLDECQTSTPKDFLSAIDVDATFIPENYQKNGSPFATTTNVEKTAAKVSNLRNGNLFSNISFLEDVKQKVKKTDLDDNVILNPQSSDDEQEFKENMNSFDRLPVPDEPKYKYKNEVVRKKVERRMLNGFDCQECEKYYSDLGLSEKEKSERLKKCSRHRAKYAPPPTPDHFWELDFPDTEECKNRGYMDATQKIKLNQLASR